MVSRCKLSYYHITARGNNKNKIFKHRDDFLYYLSLLEEALKYYCHYKYKIVCYCLMSNHVHILMKAQENPPAEFMGRINSKYALYHNKKYNYIGHLFQSRYYAELIKNDAQMIETSRYIHLNPVKANIVTRAEDYMWSSYNMYIGNVDNNIISSNNILYYFKEKDEKKAYKQFIESSIEI